MQPQPFAGHIRHLLCRAMTDPTIPSMAPKNFIENVALAASAAPVRSEGQFKAAGLTFDLKIVGYFDVADQLNAGKPDGQHVRALQEGYPYCYRLLAVGPDGTVYAVWEVYSSRVGTLAHSKSRTVEVDAGWTGRGIGRAFVKAVRARHPVQWSGEYTPAGARLKDRVEADLGSSPSLPGANPKPGA